MTHMIEEECRACDGGGVLFVHNPHPLLPGQHEIECSKCNGFGWLSCPNKGGVDCPHPQQCICEAAYDRQEQQKAEDAA